MNRLLLVSLLLFVSQTNANIVGTDMQNFNPTTSGLDFVTVHSSQVLEPGILNLGFFLNYAVNSLPYLGSASNPQSRTEFADTLFSSDINFGLGLKKNWDIGVSFPFIFQQNIDDSSVFGNFSSSGSTEVRLNSKYKFAQTDSWGFAVIGSVNVNRIKNNPFVGKDAGRTLNLELAADTEGYGITWGANVGHRWRDAGEPLLASGVEPMPNQLIASVAGSKRMEAIDTKFVGEILASYPTEGVDNISDRKLSSIEFLGGIKHDWSKRLALHLGGGTELNSGTATPDWRVYAGLNWAMGPVFKQKPWEERIEYIKAERTEIKTLILTDLRFRFNSIELSRGSEGLYKMLVAELGKLPAAAKIVIEGHTDSIGSAAYNLKLSQKRAKAVAAKVKADIGAAGAEVSSVGYGESRPIASNDNYQGRNRNRRVEVKVIQKTKVFE